MQLTHYNNNFTKRKFPITLVCDNISNAPNIGSLFRTSDAFGIDRLVLCGEHIPMGRKMTKTSRATEKYIDYDIQDNALEVIKTLKHEGFQIIALEITSNSQDIRNYTFQKQQKYALVIGDENFGISEAVLSLSDAVLHIEMYGKNSSMNVVQATTIALFEMTGQLLA